MSSEFVRVTTIGRALIITICKPNIHNALDPPTASAIGSLLDWYEHQPNFSTAIITGAGEKAFCAGFDLKYAQTHPEVYQQENLFADIVRREGDSKPVIAAVNGLAFGLGFEIALACDLIICSPHATFGLPEPKVGLAAMGGGIVRLTRHIGLKRALSVILTARSVSAEEGSRLGFVTDIVHDAPVLEGALRWAAQIAECGPQAIRASKQIAYRNFDKPDLKTALDPREYPQAMSLLAGDEPQEGRDAFLSRRKPVWKVD